MRQERRPRLFRGPDYFGDAARQERRPRLFIFIIITITIIIIIIHTRAGTHLLVDVAREGREAPEPVQAHGGGAHTELLRAKDIYIYI